MKNTNVCKFPSAPSSNDLSVACFVLETDPETMRKKVKLNHNRMILVEQGTGAFLLNDTSHAFSAGTLLFGFEGETLTLAKGEGVRYLYIDFQGTRGADLLNRFGIFPHNRTRENCNGLIPFCKDCLLSTPQENIDMAAESILLYVFSRLSVNLPTQNTLLLKILDLTEEQFRDPELSIALVAKKLGYNPKYLSHFFKEQMKLSYSEYLRSIRFKHAISLFELGISSIKNVAYLSGFSDPLYFSSAFKKAIGISPKQYIALLSGKTDSP